MRHHHRVVPQVGNHLEGFPREDPVNPFGDNDVICFTDKERRPEVLRNRHVDSDGPRGSVSNSSNRPISGRV